MSEGAPRHSPHRIRLIYGERLPRLVEGAEGRNVRVRVEEETGRRAAAAWLVMRKRGNEIAPQLYSFGNDCRGGFGTTFRFSPSVGPVESPSVAIFSLYFYCISMNSLSRSS